MRNKLLKAGWVVSITLVICILSGEILFRLNFLGPQRKYHLTVKPHNFFVTDSILGWKLNQGHYTVCAWDTANIFSATINNSGNRIAAAWDSTQDPGNRKSIQVYGCSFTFGFSVPDTATSCYKLQRLLPEVKVINKGVPGYGLTQMFLLLRQTVTAGDTPAIAVFNYANFQDIRTPLNKNWSALLGYAISQGNTAGFKEMRYPYFIPKGDSIQLQYCDFKDLPEEWAWSDKFSIIRILNVVAFASHDVFMAKELHQVSKNTTLEIARYCKLHHILPVFATVTPGRNDDILDTLASQGIYTLDYGIEVWDRYKANPYNCAPLDPEHPNGLAHTIYAQKLFNFIQEKKMLTGN